MAGKEFPYVQLGLNVIARMLGVASRSFHMLPIAALSLQDETRPRGHVAFGRESKIVPIAAGVVVIFDIRMMLAELSYSASVSREGCLDTVIARVAKISSPQS